MADCLKIARRALETYRQAQTPDDVRPPFPHCPRCLSFALYRKNNRGDYECQTCGETSITEAWARQRFDESQ
jgi:transposase-like protein